MIASILPAVIHILNQSPLQQNNGPIALILAPNNDLAEEMYRVASQLSIKCNVKCSYWHERSKQAGSTELLITTPDTMYDALDAAKVNLHRCSYFALYEIDRMLYAGFDEEIEQIVSQLRPDCQRTIWSSQWNAEIRNFSMDILHDYTLLQLGTKAPAIKANSNVKQNVKVCTEQSKPNEFLAIVDSINKFDQNQQKTLIFTETKQRATHISSNLQQKGYRSMALHTGLTQKQRNEVFSKFQNSEFPYLVLTDAIARNICFSGIDHVINYDFPISVADYLHRINRTGRSNNTANVSYTLFSEENGCQTEDFICTLKEANQPIDTALYVLKAANADSDDEIMFAVSKGKGFQKYKIE